MSGNRADLRLDGRGLVMLVRTDQTGKQLGLREAARVWGTLWRLARALGLKPGERPAYPYSLPLHVTCRPGTRYSKGDLTLNPNFSDLLMGWPPGWSACERPVTGFALWLLRMRTALSGLPSADGREDTAGAV